MANPFDTLPDSIFGDIWLRFVGLHHPCDRAYGMSVSRRTTGCLSADTNLVSERFWALTPPTKPEEVTVPYLDTFVQLLKLPPHSDNRLTLPLVGSIGMCLQCAVEILVPVTGQSDRYTRFGELTHQQIGKVHGTIRLSIQMLFRIQDEDDNSCQPSMLQTEEAKDGNNQHNIKLKQIMATLRRRALHFCFNVVRFLTCNLSVNRDIIDQIKSCFSQTIPKRKNMFMCANFAYCLFLF
jgi:hypothetical protein